MYVIKHKETGAYVAKFLLEDSYTKDLMQARLFKSLPDAEANCGKHERVAILSEERDE